MGAGLATLADLASPGPGTLAPVSLSPNTGQDCGLGTRSSRRGGVALSGQRGGAPAGPPPGPAEQAPCRAPDLKATHPCSSLPHPSVLAEAGCSIVRAAPSLGRRARSADVLSFPDPAERCRSADARTECGGKKARRVSQRTRRKVGRKHTRPPPFESVPAEPSKK
jgi:hypothetical protein